MALPPILPPPPRGPAPKSLPPVGANTHTGANPRGVAIAPPARPAANTSTGANPRGVAITPPQRVAPQVRIARGPTLSRSSNPASRATSAQAQKRAMSAQVQKMYRGLKAQGALPPGGKVPAVAIDSKRGPYEEGGVIHFPPGFASVLPVPPKTSSPEANRLNTRLNDWAREIPIHELAHTFQSPQVMRSKPLREGSAQAFADQMAPRLLPNFRLQPHNDTNYTGFVNEVRNTRVPDWIDRGQFNPINWDTPNLEQWGNPATKPLVLLGTLLRGQLPPLPPSKKKRE